jgi:signal transduction histidine kinase
MDHDFQSQVLELNRTLDSVAEANVRAAELMMELEAARATAEESDRCKSVFLATMSHELRTPLNAIIGYSEMMREELLRLGQGELADDASRIRCAGSHLLEMIHDILDYTNIESGAVQVTLETVNVMPLLSEVASAISPAAGEGGNSVQVLPCSLRMRTDPERLRQCLIHLLTNAAKFTREGVISLSATAEAGNVCIHVRDTGIGIPAGKMALLFQPFVQLDNSPSRRHGGTGLGLAISRKLCRLMGGDLGVASRAGGGSTFTITMPESRDGR